MKIPLWFQWVISASILPMIPIVNLYYWTAVQRASVLPSDGDSIAIPIIGSVFAAVMLAPFFIALCYMSLRRYNPNTRIFAWRKDRMVRSAISTIVLGAPAILLLFEEIVVVMSDVPDYEYIKTPANLLASVWLLGIRAAIVEQLPRPPVAESD